MTINFASIIVILICSHNHEILHLHVHSTGIIGCFTTSSTKHDYKIWIIQFIHVYHVLECTWYIYAKPGMTNEANTHKKRWRLPCRHSAEQRPRWVWLERIVKPAKIMQCLLLQQASVVMRSSRYKYPTQYNMRLEQYCTGHAHLQPCKLRVRKTRSTYWYKKPWLCFQTSLCSLFIIDLESPNISLHRAVNILKASNINWEN